MEQVEDIQQTLQGVFSLILAGGGIVISLMGLFLWLGGLRSLRLLAGMSMAGVGFWGAWLTGRATFAVTIAAAVIAGAGAMYFKKAAGALLGVLTAGLLVVLFFIGPRLADKEFWKTSARSLSGSSPSAAQPDMLHAVEQAQAYLRLFAQRLGELLRKMPSKVTVAALVCMVAASALALFRPLWVAALYPSALGTALIAGGMTLLLMYKGARPFAYVESHPRVLVLTAGGMILFGVLVQTALVKEKKKAKPLDAEKILQGDKG